jgi:hypothetical protein
VTFLRTKAAENDPEAFPNSDKFHHHRQFLSEGDGISCISAGTALVAGKAMSIHWHRSACSHMARL